jgi:hypothetical protein
MIDPAGRLHNPDTSRSAVSVGARTGQPTTQSFATELSNKLAGTLTVGAQAAGLPASLPAGQESVTWRVPASVESGKNVPAAQPSGMNGLVITYPATPNAVAGLAGSAGSEVATETPASFDDTYWAQQPAAVQQLRDIQNPTTRAEVAEQLAQQGYSIDVPIMVWGWDPATTMAARASMGYTWVPSASQQPVEVAPGLSFNGTSYNPNNPPAGSIAVQS